MKKNLFTLLTLLFAMMLHAQTPEAQFTAENFTVEAGETIEVEIGLDNTVTFKGFQLSVTLPSCLSFVKYREWNDDDEEWVESYGKLTTRAKSDHVVTSADAPLEGNKLTFAAYSPTNKTFKNTTGAILTFQVMAAENATSSDYLVTLNNMVISDSDDNPIYNDEFSVTVTLTGGVPTAVEDVKASADSTPVYDVLGRKVKHPTKGLYIQNGKVIYK